MGHIFAQIFGELGHTKVPQKFQKLGLSKSASKVPKSLGERGVKPVFGRKLNKAAFLYGNVPYPEFLFFL